MLRLRPLVIVIVLAFSVAVPFAAVAPATPTGPVFGLETQVDAARSGTEPSMVIGADGAIYVAAPCGVDNSACKSGWLWRSDDGGQSFQWLEPGLPVADLRGAGVGSGDSELAITPSGRLLYADLWLGSVSVSASDDRGESWVTTNPVGGTVPGSDRQWMVADSMPIPGTDLSLDVAYLTYQQVYSGIYVVKSLDGGMTFPIVSLVAPRVPEPGWHVGIEGNIVVAPDHTLYLVYPMFSMVDMESALPVFIFNNPVRVMVAKSTDGGLTWTHSMVAQVPQAVNNHFPALAVDSAGNLYAAWAQQRGDPFETSDWDIYVSVSTDGAATWSAPRHIAGGPVGSAEIPWIEAGAPGKVAIGFYGSDAAWSARDETADGGLWYARVAYSYDALSANPTWAVVDASPTPVHKGVLGRALYDFVTVRIDADGMLNFVYASDYDMPPTTYGVATEPLPVFGPLIELPLTPAIFAKQTEGPGFR